MWVLKAILVCVCWTGISSLPSGTSCAEETALQSLSQCQGDISNTLKETKSLVEGLQQDFASYKNEQDHQKETIRNLLVLTKLKDETIRNLTSQVEQRGEAEEEKHDRLTTLEEETRTLSDAVQQKDKLLEAAQKELATLRRITQWDCAQLQLQGHTQSGVYSIHPRHADHSVQVWCDMTTDGGGWTVFLNRERQTPQLNFSKTWEDYAAGFGDPEGEFWLGNRNLHAITRGDPYVLRIEAQNLEGEKKFGEWMIFSVGDENSKFKIKISDYSTESSLGDVLTENDQNGEKYNPNGMKFSTMDQDNDLREGRSCSRSFGFGGWWYNNCYRLNPTAPLGDRDSDNTKARLYYWGPDMYTVQGIQSLQLKIRHR